MIDATDIGKKYLLNIEKGGAVLIDNDSVLSFKEIT
jgi:hypothetical protein